MTDSMRIAQQSVTSQPPTNSTPIFKLSPELLNRIYDYLLASPSRMFVAKIVRGNHRAALKQIRSEDSVDLSVSILGTCRQIHDQATPMLYGLNSFVLEAGWDSQTFLHQIGPSVEFVRHVKLHNIEVQVPVAAGLKLLSQAKALQTLQFGRSVRSSFKAKDLAEALEPLMVALKKHQGEESAWDVVEFVPAEQVEDEFGYMMEQVEMEEYASAVNAALAQRMLEPAVRTSEDY
ncbi:unnamed protein product [Zymoseptoria tritici ST99CH_1E4]|uniref:F-box domain-containing protein n=1 Tax=Zymoseptoria tritici ST99CH_1E4 TaxID=1276532 RepID=A0A2H1H3Q0_ZYMTR|nr:unnamed protein product [Zymoseptoria tritici ST99CH_1E4]